MSNEWERSVRRSLFIFALVFSSGGAVADTWVCSRPGEADLYADHGGPGCRKLGEVKAFSQQQPQTPRPSNPSSVAAPQPAPVAPRRALPAPSGKNPPPFPDATVQVPLLAVTPATVRTSQRSSLEQRILNPWIGLVARLAVSYLPSGTGPEIEPDPKMGSSSVQSFRKAVAAAAKAVGYDPRFLRVRLSIAVPIDGPSAGGMLAVGIASALLGDQIRPEVCMSGTIEQNLEIRPVGRLEDKINACREFKRHELVIPFGQTTMDVALKGASYEMSVTEVGTLADAYRAVTGQSLREAPQP